MKHVCFYIMHVIMTDTSRNLLTLFTLLYVCYAMIIVQHFFTIAYVIVCFYLYVALLVFEYSCFLSLPRSMFTAHSFYQLYGTSAWFLCLHIRATCVLLYQVQDLLLGPCLRLPACYYKHCERITREL